MQLASAEASGLPGAEEDRGEGDGAHRDDRNVVAGCVSIVVVKRAPSERSVVLGISLWREMELGTPLSGDIVVDTSDFFLPSEPF